MPALLSKAPAMPHRLALALAFAIPQAALAFSCPDPDAVRSYEIARDASELYFVLVGNFADPPLRRTDSGQILAFTGQELTDDGFSLPFSGQISLVRACLTNEVVPCTNESAPWGEYMLFVQKTGGRLIQFESLCSEMMLARPAPSDLARVTACHQGKACQRLN